MSHFFPREFRCRCKRLECDAVDMDKAFLEKLEMFREKWGQPLIINSGVRCEFWNREIKGAPKSMHLKGKAVDIRVMDLNEARSLHALAESMGFTGVEISKKKLFIHLDTGPARQWSYI